jgi:hypothetical protein
MPRYTACPGFWGSGSMKADTVAVDASRSPKVVPVTEFH